MQDLVNRFVENLVGRVHGPMKFRLVLQPLMAAFFAVRDGRMDALAGRGAYFWELFTDSGHRKELIANGWKSVGRVFILAVVLDAVYQLWQLHWFYPGEAAMVALILAIIPYLLIRGPVNRIISMRKREDASGRVSATQAHLQNAKLRLKS
jgi:hypothetical protein